MKYFFIKLVSWISIMAAAGVSIADSTSRRIEVYPVSQNYYDTQPGDSLSEIAASLLPNNPNLQTQLMQDILRMNPQAFIDGNPHRLLAGQRLWLPVGMARADTRVDSHHYTVESFSWGNVKRPKGAD